ncbi:MAG: FAD-dependent oxidoreductase, partial [Gammaproteobacteria bacterium]|nr:FAD-dependent oxidoreductase [Gammaproteobacteria bacterium]
MRMQYDALIIGGGHNGLTCACYLAKAGLKVRVLERREVVGGAAVTEEFHPGFRNSVASYTVSLLNPKVIKDLRLEENGLKVVERPMANFMPLNEREYFQAGPSSEDTQREVARFSKKDAEALPLFNEKLDAIGDVLRDLVLETPPNVGGGIGDIVSALKVGNRFRKLDMEQR